MNNEKQVISQIKEFVDSDERVMLLSGSHKNNKHKLVMAILNEYFDNSKILFRANSLRNIPENDFLGFAGISKIPAAGKISKIYNNYFEFDSFSKATWNRTNEKFNFSILYPIDAIVRNKSYGILDNLFNQKDIGKIFLVTCTDAVENYTSISDFCDKHVIYDFLEDDPEFSVAL